MPEILKIGVEPKRLLVTSNPYVMYSARGYVPILDVLELKTKKEYSIYVSAKSIASNLEQLRSENGGSLVGCEIWVRKAGPEKTAQYIVEE